MRLIRFAVLVHVAFFCQHSAPALPLTGGDEKGNGIRNAGDALLCTSATGKETAELSDIFEARTLHGLDIQFENGITLREKVHATLQTLSKFDDARARKFKQMADAFLDSVVFVTETLSVKEGLYKVPPKECKFVPIAQKEKAGYKVQKKLWKLFDADSKAGLVLHAVISDETESVGDADGSRSRFYGSMISQVDFVSKTPTYYASRLLATLVKAQGCVHDPLFQNLSVKNQHPNPWDGGIQAELCETGKWSLGTGRVIPMVVVDAYLPRLTVYDTGELFIFWNQYEKISVDLLVDFMPPQEIVTGLNALGGQGAQFRKSGYLAGGYLLENPLKIWIPSMGPCFSEVLPFADFHAPDGGEYKGGLVFYNTTARSLCMPKPEGGYFMFEADPFRNRGLNFRGTGKLAWVQVSSGLPGYLPVPVSGKFANFSSALMHSENGIIQMGYLSADAELEMASGGKKMFSNGEMLKFDLLGRVTK